MAQSGRGSSAAAAGHAAAAVVLILAAVFATAAASDATFPQHLTGSTAAVEALLERVLPGSAEHFQLSLEPRCPGVPAGKACFTLADGADGTTMITGTTASELTGAIGIYFRDYCQMTVGWSRGGGSRVFKPATWPRVGTPVSRARSVPYSHVTQVCTHSYTLVWHDWPAWEKFIDWMALAGHNSIVAPTGQEEIQYKIFTEQFGLTDMEVRNWTNGPAFLTWSRGQNSHGNSIAGPLPRSFMQGQWTLAKQILMRYRELGIAGHQPAFAGYAPWALAVRQNDTHKDDQHPYPSTRGTNGAVDTAWIDGRDALFTQVADAWMKEIITDFGTDHVWQMDGFFAGGTGWGAIDGDDAELEDASGRPSQIDTSDEVSCTWSGPSNHTYLKGCAHHHEKVSDVVSATENTSAACQPAFSSLGDAKAACVSNEWPDCSGITWQFGIYQLRAGDSFVPNLPSIVSTSYRIDNLAECKPGNKPAPVPAIDPVWHARAQGAYGAVGRADGPEARWLLQGWMLLIRNQGFGPPKGPERGPLALSRLKAYATAAPPGNFIIMDMDKTGAGQWQKWHGDWGLPFIWTSLHVFGGNDGIKGNLTEINAIPFAAPPLAPTPPAYDPRTQAVGVGYTPEGLDQNPAYYELLQEASFKQTNEANLTDWLVRRAHRRYGLPSDDRYVASAWADIGLSGYAHDGQVHDPTAVGTLHPTPTAEAWTGFSAGNHMPTIGMCMEWRAWNSLLEAAPIVAAANTGTPESQKFGQYPKTFTYDLVDIGREVLAQLTIPISQNFTRAMDPEGKDPEVAANVNRTGTLYEELLLDLDRLLATDSAFMLGPWLESARALGGNATDCTDTIVGDLNCTDFMEWNARCQLTTWKPTPKSGPLGGPQDYAKKHWYKEQALATIAGKEDELNDNLVKLAYSWQTTFGNGYPTEPVGDPVVVSRALILKWRHFFSQCVQPGN